MGQWHLRACMALDDTFNFDDGLLEGGQLVNGFIFNDKFSDDTGIEADSPKHLRGRISEI